MVLYLTSVCGGIKKEKEFKRFGEACILLILKNIFPNTLSHTNSTPQSRAWLLTMAMKEGGKFTARYIKTNRKRRSENNGLTARWQLPQSEISELSTVVWSLQELGRVQTEPSDPASTAKPEIPPLMKTHDITRVSSPQNPTGIDTECLPVT